MNTALRGHGYFLELVGRRGGGPWWWLIVAALVALACAETYSRVRP